MFSLRRVKSIRFVKVRRYANTIYFFFPSKLHGKGKFELHIKDLVDIRKVQDMLLFTTLKTQIRDL